jgi:hypothetical protein
LVLSAHRTSVEYSEYIMTLSIKYRYFSTYMVHLPRCAGKLGRTEHEDYGEEILSEDEDNQSVPDEGQDQEEDGDSEGE